jgi:hypothetical protein
MKARENFRSWSELRPMLAELEAAVRTNDIAVLKGLLRSLVSGYQPVDDIFDWISVEAAVRVGDATAPMG